MNCSLIINFCWTFFDATNFKNSIAAFFLSSSMYLLTAKLCPITIVPLTPSVLPGKGDPTYIGLCGL